MARALFMAALVAAALVGSAAADASCQHTFTAADGGSYAFDLTAARTPKDLSIAIKGSMMMSAQICGGAMTTCYPASWTAPANTGIAVQTWGSVPSCNPPSCKDSTGKAVCCTADCNVVGANPAMWELTDPKNPTTGGLTLTFTGVPSPASSPFWCPYNSTSGEQDDRIAVYNIACDPKVDTATLDHISQNGMSGCTWTMNWSSKAACGTQVKPALRG